MTSDDFTMWLKGFFELTDATELTPAQVKMIKEHLHLVFIKVTPELGSHIPPLYEDPEMEERSKKYVRVTPSWYQGRLC